VQPAVDYLTEEKCEHTPCSYKDNRWEADLHDSSLSETRRYREWKAAVLEGEEAQAGLIDRAKLVLLQVYSSHLY